MITGVLPEDICGTAKEVLLLLVAVRTHSSVNDVEQRLHQIQHKRTASLPSHKNLNQVQHLHNKQKRELLESLLV